MATISAARPAGQPSTAARAGREQSRARYPDATGTVERNGVRIAYEVHGAGDPAILFLPTWSIIHSRTWKFQVPYFARRHRVVTFDGRGNGLSDRPAAVDAYAAEQFADDALAVLDATGTRRPILVGFSLGAQTALLLASRRPERVGGIVLIAPAVPTGPVVPRSQALAEFEARRDTHDGWDKWNRHYWLSGYTDFVEFFFGRVFSEPHSTKQIEDCVGWALETAPETLIATVLARALEDEQEVRSLVARVHCPVVVVHGTDDDVRPYESGAMLAEMAPGLLVTLAGSGHAPHARDPVRINLAIRDFLAGRSRVAR